VSGNNEWFTPPEYIESARTVMGAIDCDPASNDFAQNVVQATRYFTVENNGLIQPWTGRVWMNPPYSSKYIRPFIDKLIGHVIAGEVTQAITLTQSNCDCRWFHKAAAVCSAICLTRGRVKFYDAKGTPSTPTHGHCFMYFGDRWQSFADEFSQYGWIARGVR
jgi:hypothetical protein